MLHTMVVTRSGRVVRPDQTDQSSAPRIAAAEFEEDVEFTTAPAAKRRKPSATQQQKTIDARVQSVHDYMAENGGDFASKEVQVMLMSPLDFILGEGSADDERCEDVKKLVAMVHDVMTASLEKKDNRATEANEAVASAEIDEEEAIASQRNSQEKTADQETKMAEIADTLQADQQAEMDAEENLQKAQKEVEDFDAIQAEKKADVPVCKEVIKIFNELKGTDWGMAKEEQKAREWKKTEKELNTHLKVLLEYLKGLNADQSLLETLPHVFAQKQDKRGTFGGMAVDRAEQILNQRLAELEDRVNNGEKLKQDVIMAEAAAKEKLEEAKATSNLREKDLEQAEQTFNELKADEKEATRIKTTHARVVKRLKKDKDHAKKEQQKAQQVFAHLVWLRDRKSTSLEDDD